MKGPCGNGLSLYFFWGGDIYYHATGDYFFLLSSFYLQNNRHGVGRRPKRKIK